MKKDQMTKVQVVEVTAVNSFKDTLLYCMYCGMHSVQIFEVQYG